MIRLIAISLVLLIAPPALAQYAPAFPSERRWQSDRHYTHEWVVNRRERVRGWHSHGGGYYPSEERCKAPLAIVGDQYASESGAQEEARKAWMQTARWQAGERYMSVDNARDVSFECGRSSVGSVAGQVFYRCRITARPCRAEAKRGDR